MGRELEQGAHRDGPEQAEQRAAGEEARQTNVMVRLMPRNTGLDQTAGGARRRESSASAVVQASPPTAPAGITACPARAASARNATSGRKTPRAPSGAATR